MATLWLTVATSAPSERRSDRPAADRRQYLGVLHINARDLNRTLGLGPGGHGIVVLLTADRVGIEQTLVPFGQVLGRLQVGFRACQLRFIGARINLIQLLTLLHLTAFGKQALLQNSATWGGLP